MGKRCIRIAEIVGSIPTGSIMSTKEVGNFGEQIAEKYLENKGYQILDRNYSCRFPGSPQKGEIDIVAKKADIISFVEVKFSFNSKIPIPPQERVNFFKQRKLVKIAESWLMAKKIPLNSKWQIDIISVRIVQGKAEISHFENAISYK